MRCASPPESVDDSRSSVKYSSPTSFKNFSRCRISTRILSAIAASSGDNSARKKELLRLRDIQLDDLRHRLPAHANVQRLRPQPRPAAIRTPRIAAIPAHEHAHMHFVLLRIQPLEEAPHVLVNQRLLFIAQFTKTARSSAPSLAPPCGNPAGTRNIAAWSKDPPRRHPATASGPESPDPCRNRWCSQTPDIAYTPQTDC